MKKLLKAPSEAGNSDFLNSRGEDIIVPDLSDNESDEMVVENESPRGGKYNLRPNPIPKILMNADTNQTCKLNSFFELMITLRGPD